VYATARDCYTPLIFFTVAKYKRILSNCDGETLTFNLVKVNLYAAYHPIMINITNLFTVNKTE